MTVLRVPKSTPTTVAGVSKPRKAEAQICLHTTHFRSSRRGKVSNSPLKDNERCGSECEGLKNLLWADVEGCVDLR